MGSKNSGNRTGRARAPGAGRPAVKATIREGDGLMLSQVYADGKANLGRGRATVEKIGRDRMIKIEQADGSEIRILVIHD